MEDSSLIQVKVQHREKRWSVRLPDNATVANLRSVIIPELYDVVLPFQRAYYKLRHGGVVLQDRQLVMDVLVANWLDGITPKGTAIDIEVLTENTGPILMIKEKLKEFEISDAEDNALIIMREAANVLEPFTGEKVAVLFDVAELLKLCVIKSEDGSYDIPEVWSIRSLTSVHSAYWQRVQSCCEEFGGLSGNIEIRLRLL